MPRFSMKSLLIVVAVIALWLSTFAGYGGALDVRKSILLCIFLASGFAAIYSGGKRRAFWAGFFAVMLFCGGMELQRPLHRYTPDFNWQWGTSIANTQWMGMGMMGGTPGTSGTFMAPPMMPVPVQPTLEANISATIAAAWTLALSLLVGYIAATIYDQGQQNKDG